MGFYFIQKDQVLNPLDCAAWLQPVDRAVDRSLKAVDRAVDRRAQRACQYLAGGPVDRDGRPPERFCSLENPGRPSGRPTEKLFSVPEARSTGPVDRCPNGQKNDRWRSTGRSTDSSVRPPTASFWSPINWAIWGLF